MRYKETSRTLLEQQDNKRLMDGYKEELLRANAISCAVSADRADMLWGSDDVEPEETIINCVHGAYGKKKLLHCCRYFSDGIGEVLECTDLQLKDLLRYFVSGCGVSIYANFVDGVMYKPRFVTLIDFEYANKLPVSMDNIVVDCVKSFTVFDVDTYKTIPCYDFAKLFYMKRHSGYCAYVFVPMEFVRGQVGLGLRLANKCWYK